STFAILINAGVGAVISLRGLVLDGTGAPGANVGIGIEGGSALHVQRCVIRNFQGNSSGIGIFVQSSHHVQLFVSDSLIYNNGTNGVTGGIFIDSIVGSSTDAVLDHVHLENNVNGIGLNVCCGLPTQNHVIVRDSAVSGNAGNGIVATSIDPGASFYFVDGSTVVNNAGTGILATGAHATVLLSDSTVSRNGTGISAADSGQIISYGDNKVNNNAGPVRAPAANDEPRKGT